MEVRAKKALGQHFLTDQKVARAIVDALEIGAGICSQTASASLRPLPQPSAAGPSPYTCPGVDKPPGTPHPSLNASGGHFFVYFG